MTLPLSPGDASLSTPFAQTIEARPERALRAGLPTRSLWSRSRDQSWGVV
jgi:hypothetical protein